MAEISGLEKRVHRIGAGLLALVIGATQAWGAHITEFTPQGQVATVESISLAFDQPVAAFGDSRQAAPVDVVCDDPTVKGAGRWLDAQRWTYVFSAAVGPGVRCTAAVPSSFRTASNETLGGKRRYSFHTPGPHVVGHRPYGDQIDEDQVFVIEFNGAVDPRSVAANSVCVIEGIGEAVPTRLITGMDRKDILTAAYYTNHEALDTPSRQLLQCKRRLPAGAKVQLKVGPGIATPAAHERKSVASTEARTLDFTVREAFKATLSCMRESAQAPCTPVSALTLSFSAPISSADASKVRLLLPAGERSAHLDEHEQNQGWVSQLRFDGPFPESIAISVVLPEGLKDDAGRELSNADQFPLRVETAAFPPLVKFSSASFGVIERFANVPEGETENDFPPLVPLTVRNVEAALSAHDISVSAGALRDLAVADDQEVLAWYSRVGRLQDGTWTAKQVEAIMAGRPVPSDDGASGDDVRSLSLLNKQDNVQTLQLPGIQAEDPRPFEVIGIPIGDPGFHVLEVESARLGQSLLSGAKPMFVRTSVLVTNLAVHVKTGRDDMLAWVTTLDEGKVVPNADINVLDCAGKPVATGRTDDRGIWHHLGAIPATQYCEDTALSGVFVSARIPENHPLARGKPDFSFALSDWNAGIESWRFNVPTDSNPQPTLTAHTVFDRSLFRAGEVVSMKQFIRVQTRDGFGLPSASEPTPDRLVIEHQGSDQRYELQLDWGATPSGGLSALSHFNVPKTAKLGVYNVRFTDKDGGWYGGGGEFRVEEFKLPLLTGNLQVHPDGEGPVIAPTRLDADVQINYVAGGPAGRLPVSLSAAMRDRSPAFAGYEDYSFAPPQRAPEGDASRSDAPTAEQVLFLDKTSMQLDAQGGGRLSIATMPAIERPAELVFELEYPDPNGEVQTLSQLVRAWPAEIQAGVRAGSWLQVGTPSRISALALDLAGRPAPDVAVVISAVSRKTLSTRKRMVGGFYSYDNQVVTRDLGEVCRGRTSEQGELACAVELKDTGSVELIAQLKDGRGRASSAATTVWVTGKADLWFGGENDDRIDVIPSRKSWKKGEVAEFQVRMPFRYATALVAVEREGVLHTEVMNLQGRDPAVRIAIQDNWGPNVYVSVLVLRGRLRELPWHTFLEWGWQQPKAWYAAYSEAASNFSVPTPFVDLAKPAFRFGLASINVSDQADELSVSVQADKAQYQVREKAKVTVSVSLPDGTPAAHASVAFAAVDEALLELAPNKSWDLLAAMRGMRSYGVDTATGQMQVVGRRHFGRKALPAGGGGGGKSPTRELLDTLLLWAPDIKTDAEGRATLEVPLNDAITRFRLVAIADHGPSRFGTGYTDITAKQDLQVISGLPTLVREGDQYQAAVTIRNSTRRAMAIQIDASFEGIGVAQAALTPQTVSVAAGSAESVTWSIRAPEGGSPEGTTALQWSLTAEERLGVSPGTEDTHRAADRLAVQQRVIPAIPVRTQQSTLTSLQSGSPALNIPVAPPRGALSGGDGKPRGGLEVQVLRSLGGGLPGVRDWFEQYPYTCLEQTASRALGLQDEKLWDGLMQRLPDYLDEDGLVGYFPSARQGSEVLTAYLLSASHEAQSLGHQRFIIPEALRHRMVHGLQEFVQGNITRSRWAPQRDLDLRKLAALEALSRYKLVRPRMLDSIDVVPDRWPSSAVIDWMSVLQRVPGIPDQKAGLQTARKILRARMLESGTGLVFASESHNEPWWLMMSPETALAKLMLAAMDRSEWRADMPLIAQGMLGMQRRAAWSTTTSNLLGSLAIEKFSRRFETAEITGRVQVAMASRKESQTFEWSSSSQGDEAQSFKVFEPWATATTDSLELTQRGSGNPWVMIRSLAAVPVNKPVISGYELTRQVQPVSQAVPGAWSKGDVYRVRVQIRARAPTVWAVITDPIPAGATILGGGLGRDSSLYVVGEQVDVESYHPSFLERGLDSVRAYYEFLPAGTTTLEYTVRLNTVGQFQLPATRAEAMYQPDVFAELPNVGGFAVVAERNAK